jgi:uncharacterized protein (DUF4415 family)
MNANKTIIGSDLKKIDEHVIQPEEYDEIPELSAAFFEQAVWHENGKPINLKSDKIVLSIPYSPEVVNYFLATGNDWQERMNDALREWLREHAV